MSNNEIEENDNEVLSAEQQINRIMMPMLFIMIIVMIITFFILNFYQSKYIQGQITKEKFTEINGIFFWILLGNLSFPFLLILLLNYKFKLDRLRFEGIMGVRDTLEGPIYGNNSDVGMYQIQTPPDSSNELKITRKMINSLKRTRAFNIINNQEKEGNNFEGIDQSELYRKLQKDIKTISEDKKLQKDLADLLKLKKKDKIIPIDYEEESEEEEEEESEEEEEIEELEKGEEEKEKITKQEKEEKEKEKINLETKIKSSFKNFLTKAKSKIKKEIEKEISINQKDSNENVDIRTNGENGKIIRFDYKLLLKMGFLTKESDWRLGFRVIKSIKNLDDPNYNETEENDITGEISYKNQLLNATSFFYLIPDTEDQVFKFKTRRSNDGNDVLVRKCYITWVLIGYLVEDKVPLLLCLTPSIINKIYNLQLSHYTFDDSEQIALSVLTYMSFKNNEILQSRIRNLQTDNKSLLTDLSKIKHDAEKKILQKYNMDQKMERKFTMKPINLTGILISIVFFIIGLLLSKSIK